MPYVPPATVVTGTTITSAWGNSVKTGLDYQANPPACRVYHNAHQSLTNITETTLAFNSERYDTDTMHDTVTNNGRITIKTAGLYLVTGGVDFAFNTSGIRYLRLRANGATSLAFVTALPVSGSIGHGLNIVTVYKFAVNDYIELRAYQSSGGALNAELQANHSPEFAATWIGLG